MDDLETWAPVPRRVTLSDGTSVDVLPLRLGQLPRFNKAVAPIARHLFAADYITILEEAPEAAIETLRAYGLVEATVEAMFQDDVVNLLSAIYEANGDFFIRRLRPAMTRATKGALTQIAKMKTLVGERPSPGLDGGDATLPAASD